MHSLLMAKRGETAVIIDVHYHLRTDDNGLDAESIEWRVNWLASLSTKMGVKVSADQIRKQIVETLVDPDGEQMLQWMDETGVDVVVAFPVDNIEGPYAEEDAIIKWTKAVADIANRNPDKVVAFAGVDPRRKNAPQLLKRYVEEFGMKGVKYHPDLGFYPDGEESYAVMEVAAEYGLMLLSHTGQLNPPYRNKYAHPIYLDDLAVDFPEVKIIAAHMNNKSWHDWAVLASMKDHLYGDLAMWQFHAKADYGRFCRALREMIDAAGPDKIMFATDAPGFEPIIPSKRWIEIMRSLPENAPPGTSFTTQEVDAMLGGNARRVLGL